MKNIYPYLVYAGTLPFVAGAFCLAVGMRDIGGLFTVGDALSSYAFMIAVFLTGTHWGLHFQVKQKWALYLPVLSNICALSLWFFYLVVASRYVYVGLAIAFLILLAIDHRLAHHRFVTSQYFNTRLYGTLIAVASLLVTAFLSS